MKLAISHFVRCPIDLRLKQIESLIFMSDYKSANRIAARLMEDFKETRDSGLLEMKPNEVIKFLSIYLYLQEKLGKYVEMIDICESFLIQE